MNHSIVETNGIRMYVAEQGTGPLVLPCHGFPESWYSWQHQLSALADAGFHAVAPDMRGYGQRSLDPARAAPRSQYRHDRFFARLISDEVRVMPTGKHCR